MCFVDFLRDYFGRELSQHSIIIASALSIRSIKIGSSERSLNLRSFRAVFKWSGVQMCRQNLWIWRSQKFIFGFRKGHETL